MSAAPHLLIVEDSPALLEGLVEVLTDEGYLVEMAASGTQALALCEQHTFDLLMVDVMLGDMTGFDLAHTLRRRHAQTMPIVFITGQQEKDVLLEALQLGAADFVLKPFEIQELLLRVRNALDRVTRQRRANPHTGLPNDDASLTHAERVKQSDPTLVTVRVQVEPLADYAQRYGVLARSRLLLRVGQLLAQALDDAGQPTDFLGHADATTFLIVCAAERLPMITDRVMALFEQQRATFTTADPDADLLPLTLQIEPV